MGTLPDSLMCLDVQVRQELEQSIEMFGKVVRTLQEISASAMMQAALITGEFPQITMATLGSSRCSTLDWAGVLLV